MPKDNILINFWDKYYSYILCFFLCFTMFLCFTIRYFLNSYSVIDNCNDCRFFINDKCVSKLDYDNLIDRLCKDGSTFCSSNNTTSGRIYIKHEIIETDEHNK